MHLLRNENKLFADPSASASHLAGEPAELLYVVRGANEHRLL